jgi:hypothetical protein
MITIKLISKKEQGLYKQGQVIRSIEVEVGFNISTITAYYDYEVAPMVCLN